MRRLLLSSTLVVICLTAPVRAHAELAPVRAHPVVAPVRPDAALASVATSWVGNSRGGEATSSGADYVQKNCYGAWVSPDGRVVCDTVWDEDSVEGGVYKNGRLVGSLLDAHDYLGGPAITGDDQYIYFGTRNGVVRYDATTYVHAPFPGGGGYGDLRTTHSGGTPTGMVSAGGYLYVTVQGASVVEVYRTSTMAFLRSFGVQSPLRITMDHQGRLWITENGVPRAYTPMGTRIPLSLSTLASVTALGIDVSNGHLIAGSDARRSQQVTIWDVSATPRLLETVGVAGGIWAGDRPGRVGPKRFAGIVGVGVDTARDLYVIQDSVFSEDAGTGTNIDVYGPDRTRLWQLLGLEFVDNAVADPDSLHGTTVDVYTAAEHFSVDLSRPDGQQWTWIGVTTNRFTAASDPRLTMSHEGPIAPRLVNLSGRRYMAITNMYSDRLYIYAPGNGEQWTYVKTIDTGAPSNLDTAGNLWVGARQYGIYEHPYTGLGSDGVPTWGSERRVAMPAPFNRTERLRYDARADVMYVAGFTASRPFWSDADKVMGTTLARYDNWSAGNRTARWVRILPYDASHSVESGFVGLISMDLAADGRLYAVALNRQSGEAAPRTYAYDQSTGALLSSWLPGADVGNYAGWVDIMDGLNATTLSTGQTLLFQEEDARAKVILFVVAK